MHVGMDVFAACVTSLYPIIIKHRDAGAGTELWCDETEQEKWRENIAAEKARAFTVGQCRCARDVCNLVCYCSFDAKTTTHTTATGRFEVFSRIQQ